MKEEVESRCSTAGAGLLIKCLEYLSFAYSVDEAFIKLLTSQINKQYSLLHLLEKIGYVKIYLSRPSRAYLSFAEKITCDLIEKLEDADLETLIYLYQSLTKICTDQNLKEDEKLRIIFEHILTKIEDLKSNKIFPNFVDIVANEYFFTIIFERKLSGQYFIDYFNIYSEKVFDSIEKGRTSETHLTSLLHNCYMFNGGKDNDLIIKVNSKDFG
jgi:hypothetical protein